MLQLTEHDVHHGLLRGLGPGRVAREEQERASRKAPAALLSTPPPDAMLVMKRRPPVFNSYLPATAVTHGRDELLTCACEAACT